MSSQPAMPPFVTRPAPRVGAAQRPRTARGLAWGWLEVTVVAQTAFPALMFIPPLVPFRTYTRVAAFVLSLIALAFVLMSGRRALGRPFPAAPWLAAAAGWLALSIFHPATNSLASGVGQAALNIAILAPALWGGAALRSGRQVRRLMMLLLLCNSASALVGIGQFYRPNIFNPPEMPVFNFNQGAESQLQIRTEDGRAVIRPCGLTDTPGAASLAGSLACLFGLSWALRPIPTWKRVACLGMALVGVAVIYLSQVRSMMVTLVLGLGVLTALLMMRGDRRRAGLLAMAGGLVVLAGFAWIAVAGGQGVLRRFTALLEMSPTEFYFNNRGHYLGETFDSHLWNYPLGAGLGRWGQIYAYFGDHQGSALSGRGWLWTELQWTAWVYDGGMPLMLLYATALVLGLWDMFRVARSCPDEEVGYWGAVVAAWGLGVLALCFSSVPFISPTGVLFWALLAAVHAADQHARWERLLARRTAARVAARA